jgi:hypothetical protein
MPRKQRRFQEPPRPATDDLVEKLADELRQRREAGQPVVDEEEFPSGKIRVVVIWDEWERLPSAEDRTATILQAYEHAEGTEYRGKIALATGLTVPEAYVAGMLPFEVSAALRGTDPVSVEDCREAMISEGASHLFGPGIVKLRFATQEEAEGARSRLIRRLPRSEPVWVITQDLGKVEQWSRQ